jgi:hypothetical protein
MLFLVKYSLVKRKCEAVRCDATAIFSVAKAPGEIFSYFQAIALKRHNICGIYCLVLPGRINSL